LGPRRGGWLFIFYTEGVTLKSVRDVTPRSNHIPPGAALRAPGFKQCKENQFTPVTNRVFNAGRSCRAPTAVVIYCTGPVVVSPNCRIS
jgi:hypothetical protein